MDKIKVILVGAGGRGTTYVRIMKQMPDKYEVVGVADPIQSRRENIKQMHNLPDSACYNSWEEILAQPKMADLAIIGTVNLDYRSLVHHFENGVWLYKTKGLSDLKGDIEDTLSKSSEVHIGTIKTNLFMRAFRAIVRVFAPLL